MKIERSLPLLNLARQLLPTQVLWFQPPSSGIFAGDTIEKVTGEMRWLINGVWWTGRVDTVGDKITIEWQR